MMRPSQALATHRDEVQAIRADFGVRDVRIVGSVARVEDDGESDLDLAVELPDGASDFAVFRIGERMAGVIGAKVEVHCAPRPGTRIADRVARDAVPL